MPACNGVLSKITDMDFLIRFCHHKRTGKRSHARYRFLLIFCFSICMHFFHSVSHADAALEYRVKAAFIYNFISFTQWPVNTGEPILLCIYGDDPFGSEIDKLESKPVHGRNIEVKRIRKPEAVKGCKVIFFSTSAINEIAEILNVIQNQPTLTLADYPQGISQGVIINMSLAHEKVVFEINLGIARKSGLDLSSKLLQLAIKVNH